MARSKKTRLISDSMTPKEARGVYENVIDYGVLIDQSQVVDDWLNGGPPKTSIDKVYFSELDEFGPEHIAWLQMLLECYNGDQLYQVMTLLLDNTTKLLDLADCVALGSVGKTIDQLHNENEKLKAEVESWRAKYFDRTEEGAEITRLEAEVERLQQRLDAEAVDENQKLKARTPEDIATAIWGDGDDITAALELTDEMIAHYAEWSGHADMVKRLGDTMTLLERVDSLDDPEAFALAEPDKAREFAQKIIGRLNPKKTHPAPKQPVRTGAARQRGVHFGGEPDHKTWRKINDLLRRTRLDNTGLIEQLVEIEFANQTPPPPRGKPPERGDHFGGYPSSETWTKIRHLRRSYHMSNTELIAYLVGRHQ